MSVHTKLVLAVTASLLAGGTLGILALEWTNPKTLGPLGFGEKLLAAYFQAVTPRTAGFNTISIGDMTVAGALPDHPPDVHRRLAGRHRRRRQDDDVRRDRGGHRGRRCAAERDTIVFKRRLRARPRRAAPSRSRSSRSSAVILVTGAPAASSSTATCCARCYETDVGVRHRRPVDGVPGQRAQPVGLLRRRRQAAHHVHDVHGPRRPAHARVALAGAAAPPRVRYPEGKVLIG